MGYYDPPEAAEGNYSAPACLGWLDEARIQPRDMAFSIGNIMDRLNQGDVPGACFLLGHLQAECADTPMAFDVKCNFEGGSVEALFSGGRKAYTVTWTCPVCGTEHCEDREADDDHPDL